MSPSPAVEVVEAAEADVAVFAAFLRAAWVEAGPDAPGFTGASDGVIAEITTPEAFAARVGGPERRMWLARHNGDVVGFASTTRVDDTTVELAGIVVRESMAGQGVGTALLDAVRDEAVTAGYGVMVVKTEATNARARGFYTARGFTQSKREIEHVGEVDVPVAVMELRLR